jgi:hypothetical protein
MELLVEMERIKSMIDLIEGRKKKLTRDPKFFWVAKNMGEWLYYEVYYNDYDLNRLPFFDMYKFYLISKTNVNRSSREAVAKSFMDHYEDFLNVMDPQKSEDVIDEIKKRFPSIEQKISRYEKGDKNPDEKRGRKKKDKQPVVTSAIRNGRTDIDVSKLKPISRNQSTPEFRPTSSEPETQSEPISDTSIETKKRGRKPLGGEFTSAEVNRWKNEGIEQLGKIERRIDKYESQTTKLTNEIIRLQSDLDRRKRYFGVEDNLNESVEKIKLNFRRFL